MGITWSNHGGGGGNNNNNNNAHKTTTQQHTTTDQQEQTTPQNQNTPAPTTTTTTPDAPPVTPTSTSTQVVGQQSATQPAGGTNTAVDQTPANPTQAIPTQTSTDGVATTQAGGSQASQGSTASKGSGSGSGSTDIANSVTGTQDSGSFPTGSNTLASHIGLPSSSASGSIGNSDVGSSSPFSSNSNTDPNNANAGLGASSSSSTHKNTGAIIAGVLVPLFLILLAGAAYLAYRRRQRLKDRREWERTHQEIAAAVQDHAASSGSGTGTPPMSSTGMGNWVQFQHPPPSAMPLVDNPASPPYNPYAGYNYGYTGNGGYPAEKTGLHDVEAL